MASSSTPPPPASGWAGLPHDILWSVFTQLGQHEVLRSAGLACPAWRRFARDEPALWHRIDLAERPDDDGDVSQAKVEAGGMDPDDSSGWKAMVLDDEVVGYLADRLSSLTLGPSLPGWKAMALAAVDRSAGQCEAFRGRADDEVLLYLADRATCLKSLHITSCYYGVTSKAFTMLINKFPLLEELELVLKPNADKDHATKRRMPSPSNSRWAELFQSTCGACSHLRHFAVHHGGEEDPYESYYYVRPWEPMASFSIPTMRGVCSLKLLGGNFTRDVVMKIVGSCPNLESLDISGVPITDAWGIRPEKELKNKCSRIKDVIFTSSPYFTMRNYFAVS